VDSGLYAGLGVLGVDPGRAQLQQRSGCGPGQLGPLPHPGGQAEHGRLVRLERDLRQLVGLAPDPVARLLVARGGQVGLQRDAELAQFLLVALEHPFECLE
jgi:hypothetical protein